MFFLRLSRIKGSGEVLGSPETALSGISKIPIES